MRGFRFHIALLTLLLLIGCTPVDNPVFEPGAGHVFHSQTYFQGKVERLLSWTFLKGGEGSNRWEVIEREEKSFDRFGRVVEAKEWRNGKPHGHVWNCFDGKGRIVVTDKRLVNGKVGPDYRYVYEGNGFRALMTSADGIVLEKEERTYDATGELSTADRIQYPHPVWGLRKEIVRTAEGACGRTGDTVFWCKWKQGKLAERMAKVNGSLRLHEEFDAEGNLAAKGRFVSWQDTEAWETVDANGNLLRREYTMLQAGGDTSEVQRWEDFGQDGQMESVHLRFFNAHGKVFLEQVFEQGAGMASLELVKERKTYWHFDAEGNAEKEITFEDGRCVRMQVFEYVYRRLR